MMRRAALFVLLLFAATSSAHAQTDTLGYSADAPRWVGQFTTLSANAAIGGLTAGIFQKARGGSFKDGFTRGAFGGAVVYSGKWFVAKRFTGAGLIGREVTAIGTSIVRNASDGVGSLDRIAIPVAIGRFYWDRQSNTKLFKLDAVTAGFTIYGLLENELHFDTRESLSAGIPVFRTTNRVITYNKEPAGAVTNAGVIFRSDVAGWGKPFLQKAMAHERVHVAQSDQLFLTLNDRLDGYVLGRKLSRYVDLNGVTEAFRQLGRLIPDYGDRPWEMEAIYLSR